MESVKFVHAQLVGCMCIILHDCTDLSQDICALSNLLQVFTSGYSLHASYTQNLSFAGLFELLISVSLLVLTLYCRYRLI